MGVLRMVLLIQYIRIWVGTATQYAAIAQKDNNTTYIVKSDA